MRVSVCIAFSIVWVMGCCCPVFQLRPMANAPANAPQPANNPPPPPLPPPPPPEVEGPAKKKPTYEFVDLKNQSPRITCVAFSKDGQWLAVGSAAGGWLLPKQGEKRVSGSVVIWDQQNNRVHQYDLARGSEFFSANSLSFSSDNQFLAIASQEAKVAPLWDVRILKVGPWNVVNDKIPGNLAEFSPDGKMLAVYEGNYGTKSAIVIYESGTWRQLARAVPDGNSDLWRAIAFSADGKEIAAHWSRFNGKEIDNVIKFFDPFTGAERRSIGQWKTNNVKKMAFTPDGTKIVGAMGGDGTLRVWNASDGREILVKRFSMLDFAIHPDSKKVAVTDMEKAVVTVRDLTTGDEFFEAPFPPEDTKNRERPVVAWNSDGSRLAAGFGNGVVRVWRIR